MKLTGAAAANYLRDPDPAHAAILIFGADPMRVAEKRQQVIARLAGPDAADDMRITQTAASDLQKDPALLDDAIKAKGFFPGHRIVFVEQATDSATKIMAAALDDWRKGDAQLVIAAGSLSAKSPLRKLIEGRQDAVAVGLYDDPPGMADIAQMLSEAAIAPPGPDAMEALIGLANTLEPGDFRQTLQKISLYKYGDDSPLTAEDIACNAPQSSDVAIDDMFEVVATGQVDRLGPLLRNLAAQGVAPVTVCIGAMRHFRRLHAVASDPGGAAAGVGRLRPPVFGPRRDKIVRQASKWGAARLEHALTALTNTDLQLRSANTAPQAALMERTLIRLAMMARR